MVDAGQGVQAQTLANVHLAIDRNLEIVPVINKIDLPSADVEGVRKQIEDVIGLDASDAIGCSAKSGLGVDAILGKDFKGGTGATRTDRRHPACLVVRFPL